MDDLNHQQTKRSGISWPVAIVGAVVLVVLTATASFAWWNYYGTWSVLGQLPTRMEEHRMLRALAKSPVFHRFVKVLTIEEQNYYERVPLDQLLEGAISGAIFSLNDPYSLYFTEESYEDYSTEEIQGKYSGIGAEFTERDGRVVVVTPYPNAPSSETPFEGAKPGDPKGLKPDDILIKVDGQDVTNQTAQQVASKIRGPAGTIVELTVLRPTESGAEEMVFRIERQEITIPTAVSEVWNAVLNADHGPIGYLRITTFNANTANQVAQEIQKLLAADIAGLILDLRFNYGGLLDQTAIVASYFIPEGPVVFIEDREGRRMSYDTDKRIQQLNLPLVVLVNGGTASAAEIITGAIQDNGTGTIVGENTFGKGVIQQIWSLGDGTGLKITVARYLTPNGREITRVYDPETGEFLGGLEPDVLVEATDYSSFGNPTQDVQLRKGIEILLEKMK